MLEESGDLYESLIASVTNPVERLKSFVTQMETGSMDGPTVQKEKVSMKSYCKTRFPIPKVHNFLTKQSVHAVKT